MVSNLSRPITKFSYLASKETQGRLAILQNEPLEIFSDGSQYMELFGDLRKHIVDKSIQIKDPEKTYTSDRRNCKLSSFTFIRLSKI